MAKHSIETEQSPAALKQSAEKLSLFDEDGILSNHDLIFLSASADTGKTYHFNNSQLLRFSHKVIFTLHPLYNTSGIFWQELLRLCAEKGWIKHSLFTGFIATAAGISTETETDNNSKSYFNAGDIVNIVHQLAAELNKHSRKYGFTESLFFIFDNTHILNNEQLVLQLSLLLQQLNSSIKCLFLGRNRRLHDIFQNITDKKSLLVKENRLLLGREDFTKILIKNNQKNSGNNFHDLEKNKGCGKDEKINTIVSKIYYLVKGHVGLGIQCFKTDYIKGLLADLKGNDFSTNLTCLPSQLIQTADIDDYFKQLTRSLSEYDLTILALPLLNRALLLYLTHHLDQHQTHHRSLQVPREETIKRLDFYLDRGALNSKDGINYSPQPLFLHWLELNFSQEKSAELTLAAASSAASKILPSEVQASKALPLPIVPLPIVPLATVFYQKNNAWSQAIQCAIKQENWPQAVELICQGARAFSRRGQYEHARQLINQLPKSKKQESVLLALFENLLDFQQYGHQVANSHLNQMLPFGETNTDEKALITLLQHHYLCLHQPRNGSTAHSIAHFPELFQHDNEFCAWAWHGLAMEQVLAGDLVNGLESINKAIYKSFEQGDAPCALASLAWIVVPCIQQGKLSFALDVSNKVESWLDENQLLNIAMSSTIYRVRSLVFRELGELTLASQELVKMQKFYPRLDPLNLAYCYWAEFLLSLSQQKLKEARKQLFVLENHAAIHFDGWQLALPPAELLSAIMDTVSGNDIAMLSWASQFQIKHYNEVTAAATGIAGIKPLIPAFQIELIAYVRVRITLGSDMNLSCIYLIKQAAIQQDRLLEIHSIILGLLNANRQNYQDMENHYRHKLLNKAGILEFKQVYKEYIDELLPLLVNHDALLSESNGYETIFSTIKTTHNIHTHSINNSVLITNNLVEINSEGSVGLDGEDEQYEGEVFFSLTPREQEIAKRVVEGLTNNEISQTLSITVATVKGHVSNIYNKLDIKRRSQLANALKTDLNR